LHGVDAGGSPGWQEAGGEGDCAEDEQDRKVRFRVEPGDSEEKRTPPAGGGKAAGRQERDGGADDEAGEDQRGCLDEDERGHVAAVGPEGHAQADLAGARGEGGGEGGVEAESA